MKHFCPKACKFEHLVICDQIDLPRILHDPWICSVYTVYIRIDLAFIRMERRGKRHCRRIRTASSKGGDIIILIHSLESGYDHDLPGIQLMQDPLRLHSLETRIPVTRRRMHPHLERIQRHSRHIQRLHRHRHKRYRHLLACRQQHVKLTLLCLRIDRLRKLKQLVCRISHG